MGYSVAVTAADFAAEVLAASEDRPVLVDFYATWCGPCKLLRPLLEKLVEEYDFVLATVDIDREPELANRYQVSGVPDLRVVRQGQVEPGFVGALGEPELRQFLARLGLKSQLTQQLDAALTKASAGDLAGAKAEFDRLFGAYPANPEVAIAAARFLIRAGQADTASRMLSTVTEDKRPFFDQAQALRTLIELQSASTDIGDNPLDEPFAAAARQTLAEDYEAALESFLDILGRSRQYRNDGARRAILAIFSLLGETDPRVPTYRRRLMQTLF